ncbi:hypothetical protein ACQ4PT_038487 [Festuca glaucescens]
MEARGGGTHVDCMLLGRFWRSDVEESGEESGKEPELGEADPKLHRVVRRPALLAVPALPPCVVRKSPRSSPRVKWLPGAVVDAPMRRPKPFVAETRHNAHISEKCSMNNKPFPVLKLAGCGADGLQLLVAQSGKKLEQDNSGMATGLVQILEGRISEEELAKAFESQFPWGRKWKIKEYGNRMFQVKFQSYARLQELSEYPKFVLKGTNVTVKVVKWNNSSLAKFKLFSVWVRITGIPPTMLHKDGFSKAESMIGTVQEVDMAGYRQNEVGQTVMQRKLLKKKYVREEANLRTMMLAKQMEEANGQARGQGAAVIDQINQQYANDAAMMDASSDQYGDSQEDGIDIAKTSFDEVTETTQMMRRRIEKEYGLYDDDDDEVPLTDDECGKSDTIITNSRVFQNKEQGGGAEVAGNAKNKDPIVDETRRRTTRNVGDQHVMDKVADRANVKNLENIPGMDNIPTVLNTTHLTLQGIVAAVGVKLGDNETDSRVNIQAIKDLEEARFNLCPADGLGLLHPHTVVPAPSCNSLVSLPFKVRVCLQGVPDHAWDVGSVKPLFGGEALVDSVDDLKFSEGDSACFRLWVWMESVNALATRGVLKLEEPVEVDSPLIHFPEAGIFADTPAQTGPLKMVDHPVLIHLDKVIDHSIRLSGSPGSVDGSSSGAETTTWGYRWVLGVDD